MTYLYSFLCIVGGIILISFSIRIIQTYEKINDFHIRKVHEYNEKIKSLNKNLDQANSTLENVDEKVQKVKNATDKAYDISENILNKTDRVTNFFKK